MIAKVVENPSPEKRPLLRYDFILGDNHSDEQDSGSCTGYSLEEVYDRLTRNFGGYKIIDIVCRGRDVTHGIEVITLDDGPVEESVKDQPMLTAKAPEPTIAVITDPPPEEGLTWIPFQLLLPSYLED